MKRLVSILSCTLALVLIVAGLSWATPSDLSDYTSQEIFHVIASDFTGLPTTLGTTPVGRIWAKYEAATLSNMSSGYVYSYYLEVFPEWTTQVSATGVSGIDLVFYNYVSHSPTDGSVFTTDAQTGWTGNPPGTPFPDVFSGVFATPIAAPLALVGGYGTFSGGWSLESTGIPSDDWIKANDGSGGAAGFTTTGASQTNGGGANGVPEPGTLLLIGTGLLVLAGTTRLTRMIK